MEKTLVMLGAALVLWIAAPLSQAAAICCGGSCCLIDDGDGSTDDCYTTGETNPADACLACDPSTDRRAWTPIAGCGDVDAGPAEADMSIPDVDAGPAPGVDAGTDVDAGTTPAADAGPTPTVDAGSDDGDDDDDGCSAAGRGGYGAGLIGLALVFLRRRR